MRPPLRSLALAAALLVPAVTVAAASGESPDGAAAHAGAAGRDASPGDPALRQSLANAVAAGSPGALALVSDGRTIRVRAAGVADTAGGRPLRATDSFRAGSMMKPFVATVALQLVGEGRLSLRDTVERWLPGILPYGERVTLRHLLSHTSGVPDNQGQVDAEFYKGNMTRAWSPRELIATAARRKADFPAGTAWAYSNTNYMLAGLIVQRVTGHILGQELRRRIVGPLKLRHTSFPIGASAIAGGHANGYAALETELRDVTVVNPSGFWAAGNLVSNAPDIARFWRALLGGRLLAPAELAAMKSTVPLQKGSPQRYGLGIIRTASPCGVMWGHGGDVVGYSNQFFNSEDGTRQAGVMVNVNPPPQALPEPVDALERTAIAQSLGSRRAC